MILAQFLDIFGFGGFIILLICGIHMIKKDKLSSVIIIIISIIGIIADGYSLIDTFILGA